MNATQFWERAKRNPETDCWEWQGTRLPKGYGRLYYRGGGAYAHRVAYELSTGTYPGGMHVCHTCDNPSCINPSHLFLCTHTDNNRDRARKGRSFSPSEARLSPNAKLTPEAVREIRALKGVVPDRELAKCFGVSKQAISCIWTRRSWAWLED